MVSRACGFADQSMQQRHAKRLDFAARDGGLDCATRLAVVAAIAKAALPDERAEVHKGALQRIAPDMREPEGLHPRGIDDPRAVAEIRKRIESRRGCCVASCA